ncbi:hypothetical protein DPEC_G00363630 [Dallia pectoralis]|nr:hypothetical protein DPEC_G00363630 [Dallia pectoralis]
MDTNRTMHITIQEERSLPELERCTTCCNSFHWPFCSSALFHSTKWSKGIPFTDVSYIAVHSCITTVSTASQRCYVKLTSLNICLRAKRITQP